MRLARALIPVLTCAALAARAAPSRAVEPPAIAPLPPRRAPIYVSDFHQLAQLVAPDALLHPRAVRLAQRHQSALGLGISSAIIGAGLMIGSVTVFAHDACIASGAGSPLCRWEPSWPAFTVGAIVGIIVPALAWMMEPSRRDLYDVASAWNARHVDQPLTLDRQAPP